MPDAALELQAVSKSWAKRRVLRGLELRLEPGSLTWVAGRNGAGKTTMVRICAGLIDPETGTVAAFGLDPRRQRAQFQRRVSFLPAGDRGLYARLSVRQQLEFSARISMIAPSRVNTRVAAAIDAFDLRELEAHRVDRMSMGQRQRLRLAIALLAEPSLLLLDEPLTSLDAEGAALLHSAVRGLCARGGAVLWCSPSGERPELPADRSLTLQDGVLVAA